MWLFSNKVYLMQYIRFSKLFYLYLLFESVLNFVSSFFFFSQENIMYFTFNNYIRWDILKIM